MALPFYFLLYALCPMRYAANGVSFLPPTEVF
jgi:hypothetical protein